MRRRLVPWIAVAAALTAVPAHATDLASASPHLDTKSFLFSRYGTRNASVMYSGYGMGKGGVFVGVVHNPRSGYSELILGANTRLAWQAGGEQQSLTLGIAGSDASDGDYAQLYVVPSFSLGRLSTGGTLEVYEPLGTRGTRQAELNPLTAYWRFDPRWSLGTAYVLSLGEGMQPKDRGGPALRLDVPRGEIDVEYLFGLRRSGDELRISFQAGW